MKVSLSWLKELVDYDLTPQLLADKLSIFSIGVKQINDDFLELDLTYNRGDLLSMRGVAREVAAITNSKPLFENLKLPEYNLPTSPVRVEDPKLCPVYIVAKIESLKVEKSSDTWVKKLSDCGIRAINNIADVTNLIMLEYGQPMHAFDARGIKDEAIIVRTARKEEKITTLDGKTRDLDTSDLLIADPLNTLGIAGVMGGKDSEISDSTTTILLEAAIFDPVSIRDTSKRHGLYSEASKRFQHGLTKTNLLHALSAAINMYEGLGGKLTAITIKGDLQDKPRTIHLAHEKISSLLGVDIPTKQVESSLKSLGFTLASQGQAWEAKVPYWRLDCSIEEDLIEEVARIYGYEKIPSQELRGKLPEKIDQSLYDFIYKLKKALKNAGLTEVQTYSFYSSQTISNFKYQISNLLKVANPISSETQYLRNHLWPNLVEVAGKNMRQGYKDIGIFEIGKIYQPTKSVYQEEYRLSLALMNGSENPIEELTQLSLGVKLGHPPGVQIGEKIGESAGRFHPNRYVYLTYKNKPIGKIGEVHLRVLNKLGIEKRVAVLEIGLESLI